MSSLEIGKKYIAVFRHFAEDGKPALRVWVPPSLDDLRAGNVEIAWELSQADKSIETDGNKRNQERDTEVIRLKKEDPRRTAGQIAKLIIAIKPEWATMENDKLFGAANVRVILSRARKAGHFSNASN